MICSKESALAIAAAVHEFMVAQTLCSYTHGSITMAVSRAHQMQLIAQSGHACLVKTCPKSLDTSSRAPAILPTTRAHAASDHRIQAHTIRRYGTLSLSGVASRSRNNQATSSLPCALSFLAGGRREAHLSATSPLMGYGVHCMQQYARRHDNHPA